MNRTSSAALAILAGGLLATAGSLLTWSKIATAMPAVDQESYVFTGMELDAGEVTLALGVLLIAIAIVSMFLGKSARLGAGLALVGLAAGGFAATWGVMFFTTMKERSVEAVGQAAVASQGLGSEFFNDVAKRIIMDTSAVRAGWGLYLTILGGIAAFLGGAMTLFELRAAQDVESDDGSAADAIAIDEVGA